MKHAIKELRRQVSIPIESPEHAKEIIAACKKTQLKYHHHLRGPNRGLFVEYSDPIDLYFLGANVVAESTGLFLTT